MELESFYSITTFIGDMSPPPQIRQVAQLPEHYMQPARIKPDAKEHTNNPVQRPNRVCGGKRSENAMEEVECHELRFRS